MSNTIHYKVVLRDNDTLISASIHAPGWQLTYSPEHWTQTVPGSGGVFVFDSLENAILNCEFGLEVWSCECQDPLPLPPQGRRCTTWPVNGSLSSALRQFWKDPASHQTGPYIPDGTLLFNQIKLINKVYP